MYWENLHYEIHNIRGIGKMIYNKPTPCTPTFTKTCSIHGREAVYSDIEMKWLCPMCPQNKSIRKTKWFVPKR